jgi:hypothetical protein
LYKIYLIFIFELYAFRPKEFSARTFDPIKSFLTVKLNHPHPTPRATRDRYARAYAAFASAHPNILPLPDFCGDNDPPYNVLHPRYW